MGALVPGMRAHGDRAGGGGMSFGGYCQCAGICAGRGTRRRPRYIEGDGFCVLCVRTWIRYTGKYCPCCGTILRHSPRSRKDKDRFRAAGGKDAARKARGGGP